MKILKNITTLLFLVAMLFFTACNKHYAPPQNPGHAPGTTLIKFGDVYSNSEFEYDAAFHISKLTVVIDSVPTVYNISYQNGVPSQLQSSYFLEKLTYDNGNLVKSELYYNNSPDLQSMTIFNYSGNTLTEQLFYEKPVPSATLRPQLKYKYETLPNGDISMISFYLWDSTKGQYNFLGSNRYDYDGHPNPVYPTKDLNTLYAIQATPHNIHTTTSYDTSGALINVVTYDYTYNNVGNPIQVKRTNTPIGRFSTVTTINYTYR